MILMARILGVPLKVPAGKCCLHRVKGVLIARFRVVDVPRRYASRSRSARCAWILAATLFGLLTRPMSLRARSMSILCSAGPFSSSSNSRLSAASLSRLCRVRACLLWAQRKFALFDLSQTSSGPGPQRRRNGSKVKHIRARGPARRSVEVETIHVRGRF